MAADSNEPAGGPKRFALPLMLFGLAIGIGVAVLFALCCLMILVCRVWKRNRYYKKVQHSLDEEERAFQE